MDIAAASDAEDYRFESCQMRLTLKYPDCYSIRSCVYINTEVIMQFYKKLSLLASMGIMCIGLTTFSITGKADTIVEEKPVISSEVEGQNTPAATKAPTASPTPTPDPNNLEPASDEITKLITKFMNARLSCNIDDFKGLVSDTSLLDLEEMQTSTATIREFRNIECFTKKGIGSIDYVVYFTYETIVPTIETPGISIDFVYVTHNGKNKPVIFLGDLDEASTYSYLDALNYDDDVQQLVVSVNERMAEAMENDEDLKAFVEKLQNIPEGDSEG